MPSMPSMRRSVTTTCGRDTASCASACSPEATRATSYPAADNRIAISCSRSASSSTTRTRGRYGLMDSPRLDGQAFLTLQHTPLGFPEGLDLLAPRLLAILVSAHLALVGLELLAPR